MIRILLFLTFLFPFSASAETIHLGIGETHKIPSAPLETLRVEKKSVVQIKDEGSQIVFIGKKLGRTKITLGKRPFEFVVLHKYRKETLKQLQSWIKGKRGPEIEVSNNLPTLTGKILRSDDFFDLKLWTHDKSEFQNQMQASKKVLQEINTSLSAILLQNNLPQGQLITAPHWIYQVPSSQKAQMATYKKILNPLGIEAQIDPHSISDTPVIKVEVFIAYVKKSFMREFGIQWPSELSASVIPGNTLSWQSLQISLKALESHGMGRMLATPSLVTESNSPAEFHSGGEFPIRSSTQFTNNVEWKRYGLFLKTTPIANSQKHLRIKIDLNLSSLDSSSGSQDIPALSTSGIKTQVNMKEPQPILLSGFFQQRSGQARAGLPWLSQIPIFNPLFSSGQISDDEYELIFILFPSFHHD